MAVIKRLVADLGFETEIVVVPTVREASGLAMSSRNERLSPDARDLAAVIINSLRAAKMEFKRGERNAAALTQIVLSGLSKEPLASVDHVAVVDAATMEPVERVGDTETLIIAAVEFAGVRLIDNVLLNRGQ